MTLVIGTQINLIKEKNNLFLTNKNFIFDNLKKNEGYL